MNFTNEDIAQIENKGLTVDKVQSQIELFKKGMPYVNLASAATIKNGIIKCSEAQKTHYIDYFEKRASKVTISKFVPASGAATRMFKNLFKFIDGFIPEKESLDSFLKRHKDADLHSFFSEMEKLPFYGLVHDQLKIHYPDYNHFSDDERKLFFVKTLLNEDKMNFGDLPKGLLPFHNYKKEMVTAFEEHFFEGASYASTDGKSKMHFTISERHENNFNKELERIKEKVENKTLTKFEISFSYQKESTDTIAVTPENEIFRDEDGKIMFRPSGHGALLENLNQINADVIFIKNIDNTVVEEYQNDISEYKKILGGMLLEIQDQAFQYLNHLENSQPSNTFIHDIADFLNTKVNSSIEEDFKNYQINQKVDYLIEKLNRPIRICGMVKNEGEPGGGPFWVKDGKDQKTLQIVESAQIDTNDKSQMDILNNATHFNPVDLVCGIKNYKGEIFDLQKFVDPTTAFITVKTSAGKELKALELPGLWNGSMSGWNTIFVEVPLVTFNPVKTVADLLKPTHQVNGL